MRNETANNKHLMLFSGRAYPELAEEIAQTLETNLVPTRARDLCALRGVGTWL